MPAINLLLDRVLLLVVFRLEEEEIKRIDVHAFALILFSNARQITRCYYLNKIINLRIIEFFDIIRLYSKSYIMDKP